MSKQKRFPKEFLKNKHTKPSKIFKHVTKSQVLKSDNLAVCETAQCGSHARKQVIPSSNQLGFK